MKVVFVLLLLAAAVAPGTVCAQYAPGTLREVGVAADAAAPAAKPEGRARFFDPVDGQLDLSSFLENPRGFLPIPLVVTEPAVGYGGGGVGMFLRPREEAGDAGWARPDISAVGALATQNGTWGVFGGDSSRWLDGRLRRSPAAARARSTSTSTGWARPPVARPAGALFAAVRRSDRAGQLATRARIAMVASACATCYANVEPKLRDTRYSRTWPTGSASTSRRRPRSSSSTPATTSSRPPAASTRKRPTWRRAKRWAPASTSSASSRC